jgi:hypothetical protein
MRLNEIIEKEILGDYTRIHENKRENKKLDFTRFYENTRD